VDGERVPETAIVVAEYQAGTIGQQIMLGLDRASLGSTWWVQPPAMIAWALLLMVALVGAVNASWRSMRMATLLVIAVALLRGLLWAGIMPPLEGMDEGAHVGYGQFLAEEHRIPVRGKPYDGIGPQLSEQITALDAYQGLGGGPPSDRADFDRSAFDDLEKQLANSSPRSNGDSAAAGYPPLYYAATAIMYDLTPGTLNDKIYGMRLVSILLGGLAAWATLLAARRLLPRRETPAVLFALAVTLQPMMSHQFAIVNNDALVIAAGIGAFAMALRLAQGKVRARHVLVAGALVGAALLAKPFGIGIAPVVALGWLIGMWRDGFTWRRGWRQVGAGLLGVAVTYGTWVLAQLVFNIPSTSLPVDAGHDPDRRPQHYIALQFVQGLDSFRVKWGDQLFGLFSWGDIRLPMGAYDAIWWSLKGVVALAIVWLLVGLVRLVVRGVGWWRTRGASSEDGTATPVEPVVGTEVATPMNAVAASTSSPVNPADSGNAVRTWLSAVTVLGTLSVLYLAGYLYFRSSGIDGLLQGRYALIALPALMALPFLLLEGLGTARAVRWRTGVTWIVPSLLLVAMWALQVLSIITVADHFYL